MSDLAINQVPKDIDVKSTNKKAGANSLAMEDFLQLIVAQFQNQDPENAASSSDMLNQLVQMAMIQSITNITDATTMMYTASLVGKEVTVGEMGKDGKLKEIVGTVTATGTYGGEPVIFVDGVSYKLSSIMAVGRLPDPEPTDPDDKEDNEENSRMGTQQVQATPPGSTDVPGETEKAAENQNTIVSPTEEMVENQDTTVPPTSEIEEVGETGQTEMQEETLPTDGAGEIVEPPQSEEEQQTQTEQGMDTAAHRVISPQWEALRSTGWNR